MSSQGFKQKPLLSIDKTGVLSAMPKPGEVDFIYGGR